MKGGANKRRILLLATLAALMAAMMVASAATVAFAAPGPKEVCPGFRWVPVPVNPGTSGDANGNGLACLNTNNGQTKDER